MHSTIGNRMRMWPNRQRIGLRIRSVSAGRDKRSGSFIILLRHVTIFNSLIYLFMVINRVAKSVMGIFI